MECKFEVGQRVVCIATVAWCKRTPTPFGEVTHLAPGPGMGDIVKIKSIVPCPLYRGHVGLQFVEWPERHYRHEFFRPLQDRPKEADTDISALKRFETAPAIPIMPTPIEPRAPAAPEKVSRRLPWAKP